MPQGLCLEGCRTHGRGVRCPRRCCCCPGPRWASLSSQAQSSEPTGPQKISGSTKTVLIRSKAFGLQNREGLPRTSSSGGSCPPAGRGAPGGHWPRRAEPSQGTRWCLVGEVPPLGPFPLGRGPVGLRAFSRLGLLGVGNMGRNLGHGLVSWASQTGAWYERGFEIPGLRTSVPQWGPASVSSSPPWGPV